MKISAFQQQVAASAVIVSVSDVALLLFSASSGEVMTSLCVAS